MKLGDKKAQVAVEFLFMFIVSALVIIYIFYFSLSLSVLQYKQYATFMVGRAISSSSNTYSQKAVRANIVKGMYDSTQTSNMNVSTGFICSIQEQYADQGFRNIMRYWEGTADRPMYYVFSTAGIACNVELPFVLPNIISGEGGESLQLAIESMTGSEISDEHCRCLLDFSKTWEQCLNEAIGGVELAIIDNGC